MLHMSGGFTITIFIVNHYAKEMITQLFQDVLTRYYFLFEEFNYPQIILVVLNPHVSSIYFFFLVNT